ncbi:uncharacterized protein LOC143363372 [Halictus rubicundus]|uniref:uncharacterized protein LOC143363372 n=1 Tax=Halictus rubicundus TaxID=77578 RepID=UPI0040357528
MPMTNPSLSQATALSTLKHSVDTEQPPDIDLIKMHLNGLIEFWKRFDDIQSELEALDENQEPRRYEIQNEYYAIVVRANKIIEKAQPTLPQRRGTVESLATSVTAPMAIKLPEMRLPSFDGNIEDWVSYFDTFKSTIDSNENLTPLQKLQYLRSTLHGKALKCISALNTTDANYYDAIELLKKKYDCPRRIILKHCDAIRDYPRLVKDTPEALDDLVNSVNQHLRALKNLGEDFTRCNGSLISMILSKVSSDTAWLWELTIKGKNMPSYTDLLDFLEKRASCAQTGPSSASAVPLRPRPNFTSYPQSTRPSANFTSHPQSTRPPARSHAFVTSKTRQTADNKSKNASNFNETRPNSQPKECPICYGDHSTWGCEKFRGMTPEKRKFAVERAKLCTNCLHPGHSAQNCDRVTAQIQIFNKNKRPIDCRALIDTCASINLISERLAQKINIPRMKCSVPIGSLNAMTTVATHALKATIASRVSNYQRSLTFLIVNDIAPFVPDQEIDRGTIKIPPNLHLADPEFHRPAPIDLLLGSGTALSILCVGQIVLSRPDESDLYLQKSQLGWVIGGSAPVTSPAHGTLCHATTALQFDLTRFWEVEEGPQRQHLSESDIICESHFQEHTVRNRDGRYVVALPFNCRVSETPRILPDLGHMSELPQEQQSPEGLRRFCTTNSGIALNDALHTGPKIQDDLLHILLRFRIHRYVLTGDIEKMYRQFLRKILLRDFYVDDVLTGTSTIEEALSLREDLTQILKTARLTIRQWASNDLTLLTGLPEQAINKKLYLGESSTLKTLGIVWNSSNDSITYAVETCSPPSRSTKRSITSEIAKIYDPLGLLGPVIITAKMLLQRIWTIKVDWDESLPMDIHTEWIRFYNKLPALNNITFPRRTIIESPRKSNYTVLVTQAKRPTEHASTCVAPLKTISIPRLELCGALLLTSLVETAKQALPVEIHKTIRNCVRCYRVQPPPTQYVMGDLPEARVTDSRPFANVGVDYCGPFFIKERRYRSRTHIKVYVAVFVCLSVKAIHLELVSDLTSEAFIAALRRFIARRGHCINIYSDNGTNFVGANNELRDLRELLQSDDHNEKVKTFLADRSITWNFIPPLTPHFGGIWEAAVKSFKRHFWRIAGAERFTFEVFNTLIIEIEAVLNSRPLTPISSDPNDTLVLTPGHFLIGDSLTSLRERDFRDVPSNRLSTWQHIQKLKQHFWNRWYKEYLNEMTSRSRWSSGTHPIKEGTIVLLREDNVPPMQWPLGRVIKVYPGSEAQFELQQ